MHRHALRTLIAGAAACALVSGCSNNSRPAAYLKSLQQAAIAGSLPPRIDPELECPQCDAADDALAQKIVDAEHELRGGCAGLSAAESNYRQIRDQLADAEVPALPEYRVFASARMCTIARAYASCTDPANRRLEVSNQSGGAAPLVAAIDQCRSANPQTANEITADVLHNEAQAVSDAIMSGDFTRARREALVYRAVPSSNHERVEEWLSAMGAEEQAEKRAESRARARAHQMVCGADVTYYDHDDKGELFENSIPGMNLRAKFAPKKRDAEDAGASVQKSARQKLEDLTALLANEANLSLEQSRRFLTAAYREGRNDPTYCDPRDLSSR